jgi:predicted DCC family thiol-disulfide oxidoreductase YuxK
MNLNFLDRFSKNTENIEWHENPFSEIRVVTVDGQADITKLAAAFRKFANVPKNWKFSQWMSPHDDYEKLW